MPGMVRVPAPGVVARTRKALPAGAEPVSRASLKTTLSVVPSTDTPVTAGGVKSCGKPWTAILMAAVSVVHDPVLFAFR